MEENENNFEQPIVEPQPEIQQPIDKPVEQPSVVNNSNNGKKKSKKVFIIIPIIVAVIAAIVILFLKKPSSSKVELSGEYSKFDINALIPFYNGEFYGYMDTNGKEVIKAQYLTAYDFVDGYAIVKGQGEKSYTSTYKIIDKKGNVKVEYSYNYEEIPNSDVMLIDYKLYDKKFKQITSDDIRVTYNRTDKLLQFDNSKDKTKGIMNTDGKVLYKISYSSGEYVSIDASNISETLKERYCVVSISKTDEDTKYGIINCNTGKIVYDFSTNKIYDYDDNIFSIYDEDSKYTKNYIQNDKVFYTSAKGASLSYKSGVYLKESYYDDNYKSITNYIDLKTGKKLDKEPTIPNVSVSELSDWEKVSKSEIVESSRGYCLVNNNRLTIPCEWKKLYPLEIPVYSYLSSKGKAYIIAKKNDLMYLVSVSNGKVVYEFKSTGVTDDNSIYVKYTDPLTEEEVAYNLLNGKTIRTKGKVSIGTNYVVVIEEKARTYYNSDAKAIYTNKGTTK